jgi:predicted nucleotidyltransferase
MKPRITEDQRKLYRLVNRSTEKLARQQALFSRKETLFWRLIDWHVPSFVARLIANKVPRRWLPVRGLDKLPAGEREHLVSFYQDMSRIQWNLEQREYRQLAEEMNEIIQVLSRAFPGPPEKMEEGE